MELRRPRWRSATRVVTAAAALAVALTIPGSATFAHDMQSCLSQDLYGSDPNCRAHWYLSHMNWHWGPNIDVAHHQGHKDSFQRAVNRWEAQSNPDSEWEEHFNVDAETHVDVLDSTGLVLGKGRIAQENSADHIPIVIELWVRHDVEEIDCSGAAGFQACSWYTSTGTPTATQIDEWSVWQEETGHAQNISHHTPPGHEAHMHLHTMAGGTQPGTTTKRSPTSHENEHACYAYELVHTWTC